MIRFVKITQIISLLIFLLFLVQSCNSSISTVAKLSIKERKIAFGKELFFDKNLSLDGTISCATCHVPAKYFTDNQVVASGIHGRKSLRNVPSLYNVKDQSAFQLDGGVKTLEMQLLVPIQDTNEMGERMGNVIRKVSKNKKYQSQAKELYNRKLDAFVLSRAIAAYERTLVSSTSKYDQYKKGKVSFLVSEKRGERLFKDLNCVSCHSGKNFTNYNYYSNGIVNKSVDDLGRFRITEKEEDRWKFKVPSLRNCAKTNPYLHDGSLQTLAEVIEAYQKSSNPATKIRNLSKREETDLILFLKTLTDKFDNQ